MLQQLLTCEDRVAVAERRLEQGRAAVAIQATRTRESIKARLSRADALAASAGLGVLYGLWVTRPSDREPARRDEASGSDRSGRSLPIPGWLVRAGLSMMVSRFLATPAPAGATDSAGGGQVMEEPGMGLEP